MHAACYPYTEQLKLSDTELGERVLRSEHRLPTAVLPLATATRKRKPLTSEELEERRKKVWRPVPTSTIDFKRLLRTGYITA